MGNIPLATVLNANGVLFAGIMAFIYSDLMVPPLVLINARYYGWRTALYIAGVMYVSIVATALTMHAAFGLLDITPDSARQVEDVVRFAVDYTLFLNIGFALAAAGLVWLSARGQPANDGDGGGHDHGSDGDGGIGIKRIVAVGAALILAGGLVAQAVTELGPG